MGSAAGVEPARTPIEGAGSGATFLVLRRMRAPLIALIVIFAVSVLGLTLVPGEDADGNPHRLGIFEAFYVISYTASTIGFGELPHPFSPAQRMWVTFAIFLSVIGWAYGVGSLLALIQDRPFRRELARRTFERKVSHLAEPFLVLVGYGQATRRLARSLDGMGRRFVILERDEDRLAQVELDGYHADVPALLGDARETHLLLLAGVSHRHCEGVVALTDDDETNLDVTMTAGLLRPGLHIIARTSSREIGRQMTAFGADYVVNPLDRFGDHLRILLRAPSAYRLMVWLTSAPGTPLPALRPVVPEGRWVIHGDGRFAAEIAADLRAEGVEVHVGREDEPVEVAGAVAFVAASDSDTTNLWLAERARRADPAALLVTLEHQAGNLPLFEALGVDFGMSPAEVVVHEVLARLANPALMRFLPVVPHRDEAWAAALVDRIVSASGTGTPELWLSRLDAEHAPGLQGRFEELTLGRLLRHPQEPARELDLTCLALLRGDHTVTVPDESEPLLPEDQLLLAGGTSARRALEATLLDEVTAAYVISGELLPRSWVWRRLTGGSTARPARPAR